MDLTPDHLSAKLGEASSGMNYAPTTRTDEAAYGQEEKSEELSGGATQWCRLGKLEFGEEGVLMRAMWIKKPIVGFLTAGALVGLIGLALLVPSPASAVSMTDYTWMPVFAGQTVPPNILFLVDLGNHTLPAAYSGTNHQYPISFCSNCTTNPMSTVTSNLYASNVTLDNLIAVNKNGVAIAPAPTTAAPADTFDPTHNYYGMFDPFRCYTTNSNSFTYGSTKTNLNDPCASTFWDGNFLNWLTMRKTDVIYQALVGGAPKPAQANVDGTANSLAGQDKTGENGSSANTCADNTKSCWRVVEFVRIATPAGPLAPIHAPDAAGGALGRFLMAGAGQFYGSDDATSDPFNTATANQYILQVDLTTEPDVPSGTGSMSGTCDELDPNFAGHLVCYKRDRSLGPFQKLRLDAMRGATIFVDAGGGHAGHPQFLFDAPFVTSSVTNIRNQAVQSHSPLPEALHEGLSHIRNSP